MKICKVTDFFWPIICGSQKYPKKLTLSDINVEEKNIDKTLEYVFKIYESEENRKKNVENKSIVFISITGAIAILSTKSIPDKLEDTSTISFIILLTIIVYLLRTVWLSINVLKKQNYYTLGPKDVLLNAKNTQKDLILNIINNTRSNYNTINSKVDNMALAQGFFQRAVFLIFLYVLSLFINKINILNTLNPFWNIYSTYKELINILGVLVFFAFIKLLILLLGACALKK